jgi:5-methylcytosine-specific restriction enzyme A
MSRLTTLGPRVPPAAARLSRRPKITDAFYSSPEWRDLVRTLIATRGRRCEDKQCFRQAHSIRPDRKACPSEEPWRRG